MKIGQNIPSTLLEQMQAAHAEGAKAPAQGAKFAAAVPVEPAAVEGASAGTPPALQASISRIASRMLSGELKSPEQARTDVLQAIVKDRWGEKLSAPQQRQLLKGLEQNLSSDPSFIQEVDQMLILAALELGKR